jgi:hypothetical protein
MTTSRISMSRRDFGLCLGGLAVLSVSATADSFLNEGLSDPAILNSAKETLSKIPETIGAWTSTPLTIDERELRLGEISGYFRREFRHAETGRAVALTILCGAAGPMSVHPPTACFEGVGYSLISGPSVVGVTDADDVTISLNKATFRPQGAMTSDVVRVFWGWSPDGAWDAPANPRIAYRGQPVLFKLYTVDRAWDSGDGLAQSETFLTDALPVIRRTLAASQNS